MTPILNVSPSVAALSASTAVDALLSALSVLAALLLSVEPLVLDALLSEPHPASKAAVMLAVNNKLTAFFIKISSYRANCVLFPPIF
jgi:hypothetical protein